MNTKEETLKNRKMDARIKEMKADLESLRAKATRFGADTELTFRRKFDEFEGMLDDAMESGEDRWENVSETIESRWNTLVAKVKAKVN